MVFGCFLRYHVGMSRTLFSDELEAWLKRKGPKTLAGLSDVFAERSFAIIILLLLSVPALPLPTGGVTHVFELIVALLALEMIAGLRTIWLPAQWKKKEIGETLEGKAIPLIVRWIRWFERYSRPRLRGLLYHGHFSRLAGLVLLILTTAAFMAPPFSGLDTLPALGGMIVALSLILGDAIVFIVGCVVGATGIALIFVLGEAALTAFRHFF